MLVHIFSHQKDKFYSRTYFAETTNYIVYLYHRHLFTYRSQGEDIYIMLYYINPYPVNMFLKRMLSAYYFCCINSNALQNTFSMEANTMNPDQTALKGAV